MPCLRVVYNSPASLRAVAVTALAWPTRAAHRREKAPRAVGVRPTFTADTRKNCAARFAERRVLLLNPWPPDLLLPGAHGRHEVQCFSVGHRLLSMPHSPTSVKAGSAPKPWLWRRAVPHPRNNRSRTSNVGALSCRVCWERALGRGSSDRAAAGRESRGAALSGAHAALRSGALS